MADSRPAGRERRGSMFEKTLFKEILTDRLKDSFAEVTHADGEDGEDVSVEKGMSSVWKASLGKGKISNTYRLEPLKKFTPCILQRKAEKLLMEKLKDIQYNADQCRVLSDQIANLLLAYAKGLGCDRYKYVVRVMIGEKNGQSVKIASRALWDAEKDNWVSAAFENSAMFAVALVFALYFE
ncbi:tctex1 domain-containing protein 3 [Huso huso]|uniref:Tctex1 domain-containing protein 3 n=1 Tax=Huso huso TaxID=61971 RepID=A0ABR0YTQ6_HUSHU